MRTCVLVFGGFILGVVWQTLFGGHRRRRSGTVKVPHSDGSQT
jgi:hypothetical protein